METIKEKVEAMDKYSEDFHKAVKEKGENTARYIKAFYG